jgi:hypothetical protein
MEMSRLLRAWHCWKSFFENMSYEKTVKFLTLSESGVLCVWPGFAVEGLDIGALSAVVDMTGPLKF